MTFLSLVTVEVPRHHLESAAKWYEGKMCLTRMSNGEDDVRFVEGVRLIGVKHWESHSMSQASFTLVVGEMYEIIAHYLYVPTADDTQTFTTIDPWGNKIELRRS